MIAASADHPQTPPVIFAGAGPGAAEHLTLGVLRALEAAEVVIHDRLVGAEVLALIPAHVRRIDVGKEGFGPSTAQSEINRILVEVARAIEPHLSDLLALRPFHRAIEFAVPEAVSAAPR